MEKMDICDLEYLAKHSLAFGYAECPWASAGPQGHACEHLHLIGLLESSHLCVCVCLLI